MKSSLPRLWSFQKNFCAVSLLLSSAQSFAWGDLGHEVIGYIAEKALFDDARAMLFEDLGFEPLSVAARFADDVRSDDRYKGFDPYHYVEIPGMQSYDSLSKDQRSERNAVVAIRGYTEALGKKYKKYSTAQRKLMIRYLAHIVGDIHQPLHVGNGLDMGGNLCDVQIQSADRKEWLDFNLHKIWDVDLVDRVEEGYKSAAPGNPKGKKRSNFKFLAESLIGETEKMDLPTTKVMVPLENWLAESQKLHSLVYPGGEQPVRVYCKRVDRATGKVVNGDFDSRRNLPRLDERYLKAALPVVKERLVLAGLRLADLFHSIAKDRGKIRKANPTAEIQMKEIQFEASKIEKGKK